MALNDKPKDADKLNTELENVVEEVEKEGEYFDDKYYEEVKAKDKREGYPARWPKKHKPGGKGNVSRQQAGLKNEAKSEEEDKKSQPLLKVEQ